MIWPDFGSCSLEKSPIWSSPYGKSSRNSRGPFFWGSHEAVFASCMCISAYEDPCMVILAHIYHKIWPNVDESCTIHWHHGFFRDTYRYHIDIILLSLCFCFWFIVFKGLWIARNLYIYRCRDSENQWSIQTMVFQRSSILDVNNPKGWTRW